MAWLRRFGIRCLPAKRSVGAIGAIAAVTAFTAACLTMAGSALAQSRSGAPLIDAPQTAHHAANALAQAPLIRASEGAGASLATAQTTAPPDPPSVLYSSLYRDVELAHLFPDSKTFADMIPDQPPARIVRLYHPRKDRWGRHFAWDGPRLHGKTAIGRATIEVLAINHPDYVAVREAMILEGTFPP